MTQHMGMMDFSDEEEKDEEEVVGYLQLLPPLNKTLGWTMKEFKDGERRREIITPSRRQATQSSATGRYRHPVPLCMYQAWEEMAACLVSSYFSSCLLLYKMRKNTHLVLVDI